MNSHMFANYNKICLPLQEQILSYHTSRETHVIFDSSLLFALMHIYFNSEENECCIRHKRDYFFRMLDAYNKY